MGLDHVNLKQWKRHHHHHLVGGLEHDFYFPFHIWVVILPIDEVIFFKMVKPSSLFSDLQLIPPPLPLHCAGWTRSPSR